MEQLPGLDTAARMEQLPGWNNYLGSNLRPQTTRALTLPIELRSALNKDFQVLISIGVGTHPHIRSQRRAVPLSQADFLAVFEFVFVFRLGL